MDSIDDLLAELAFAKTNLQKAKDEVLKVEEKILNQQETKDKGSKTITGGNGLKLTITTGYSYKLESGFPKEMPTKMKTELDASKYEKIRESDPDLFNKLSEFVTAKPKKPSLSLKVA